MQRLIGFLVLLLCAGHIYASTTPAPTRLTNTVIVGDGTTGSKYVKFDSGQGGLYWNGTTTKLSNDGTTFMTLQGGNDTLVGRNTIDTLLNKTLNNASIQNSSLNTSNVIDARDDRFTLYSAATSGKSVNFDLSGLTNPSIRIMSVPDYDGTLAVLNHAQTFTGVETFSSAGHVVMNDSGGNGGNVPHQVSTQTNTTSSTQTLTICCDGANSTSVSTCSITSNVATGGGCTAGAGNLTDTRPAFNLVGSIPRGWHCERDSSSSTLTAYVICMDY